MLSPWPCSTYIRYIEPTYQYPRLPPYRKEIGSQYDMKRVQEIVPGVYLGPYSYAPATTTKLEDMKAAGLTHIICVKRILESNRIPPDHPEYFKYLVVEISDSVIEKIIPHTKLVQQFIDECLASGGKALVHGNGGISSISTSPVLVIGYIMARYGVTVREAYQFVDNKHPIITVKEQFMDQLREYEPICRAKHLVPMPLPEGETQRGSRKRSLESDEGNTRPKCPRNSNGKAFAENLH